MRNPAYVHVYIHTCSRYKGLDQYAHRLPNCPCDYLGPWANTETLGRYTW